MSISDPAPVTTTLLLERLRDAGDEGAWVEFDARFRRVVVATAMRLGLARSDAEDAAQETMLQAYRDYRSGKYDRSRGRLSSWLIGIAHHRIVDVKRRQHGVGRAGSLAGCATPAASEVTEAFDHALERLIFEDAWTRVQARASPRDQALRAFELTAMRGVPIIEAARQCSLSVEQVYIARYRTSERLRDEVDKIDKAYRDGF